MSETHRGPKKHMVASDETKCQGWRQPLHRAIETNRKRGEAVLLGQDSFPDVFQDIGCGSGNLPASRETYWITDNLGTDRASPARRVLAGGGGGQRLQDLLPPLTFLPRPQIFSHLSHSPASQSMRPLMMRMRIFPTLIASSK